MNPHLKSLNVIVGTWSTRGRHPMIPHELHGTTTFEWIEEGAFLRMRSHVEDPRIPDGIALFGCDGSRPYIGTVLYYDTRTVAREYHWTLAGNEWTWTRDDPKLAQKMIYTLGDHLAMRGEMSEEGAPWKPDLALRYTRV